MDGNITIGSDNGEVAIPLYDTKISQVYKYIQEVIETNNLIVPTTSSGTE